MKAPARSKDLVRSLRKMATGVMPRAREKLSQGSAGRSKLTDDVCDLKRTIGDIKSRTPHFQAKSRAKNIAGKASRLQTSFDTAKKENNKVKDMVYIKSQVNTLTTTATASRQQSDQKVTNIPASISQLNEDVTGIPMKLDEMVRSQVVDEPLVDRLRRTADQSNGWSVARGP